jgi:hypothetical protein
MDRLGSTRLYLLVLLATVTALTGCADGPVPYLVSLNPKRRQQWEADEMYQPTLHRQLAEVEALREGAEALSADQQRHWSGELQHIIETHDNALLRGAAVDTLAEFSVTESKEGLRIALKDSDSTVRRAACSAWGKRGDREAVERLSETLGSDTDPDVRISAARELGRFQDPVAYQALSLALEDTDPALRYRSIESLRRSSGKNYGNDLKAWQTFAQGQDAGPEYVPSLAERFHEFF